MRFSISVPAIGLATVIALAGLTSAPASVVATDPSPTPAPTASESPSPAPTPTPTPTATPDPSSTAEPTVSRAELIREDYLRAAKVAVRQRDDRYVLGAIGPNAFDCSGLVRFSYRKAGISRRLGGGHSARAMLTWARRHNKTRKPPAHR